jgi:hypothetical protein
LFGLPIALPAGATSFLIFLADRPPCFATAGVTGRVSATARAPNQQVKIDNHAVHPDLRVQPVDGPAMRLAPRCRAGQSGSLRRPSR